MLGWLFFVLLSATLFWSYFHNLVYETMDGLLCLPSCLFHFLLNHFVVPCNDVFILSRLGSTGEKGKHDEKVQDAQDEDSEDIEDVDQDGEESEDIEDEDQEDTKDEEDEV